MKAVILAAGMGIRLRPITKKLPKGLTEIKGKSLLEYSLDALSENGIKEVIIVIGFLGELIKQKFEEKCKGLKITYALNKKYSKTGSMYSLSKAKKLIGDDIILLESDLLYDPKAIEIVLSSKFKDLILVTNVSGSGDEVFICVDNTNKIIDLGKNIYADNEKKALGELVGISKFSKGFLSKLFKKANNDYEKGKLDYHYEECVFDTSKLGNPVYALLYKDLVWVEIDNEDDLKRAREEIYPKIRNKWRMK